MTVSPSVEIRRRGRRTRWAAIFVLLLIVLGFFQLPVGRRFGFDLYLRVVSSIRVARLSGDRQMVLPNFVVYYPTGQKSAAQEAGRIAEAAWPQESRSLGVSVHHKIPLILFSSPSALNVSVGFPAHEDNIGLYWLGTIGVLSPQNWNQDPLVAGEPYATDSPIPHELGHALLAYKAQGNYPSWFNEGIAQYEDWQVSGYRWLTPLNQWNQPIYTADQLTHGFYQLPNQSMAYREGFSEVRYLVSLKGAAGLRQFLTTLASGASFNSALHQVYGISNQQVLWQQWKDWRLGPSAAGNTAQQKGE